jgi:trans-aconitate 2-methyltransferase
VWDPEKYRQYGQERSRPFYDLTVRVGATEPAFVADLGCGSGELTADLRRRWPAADILGVDSSAEMISAANGLLAAAAQGAGTQPQPGLRFEQQDARDWEPGQPPDVIVSNALLQWIPDHESLITRWAGWLTPGGWLAFAMPANFDQPTHRLLRELTGSPRWKPLLDGVELNRQAADPGVYLDLLAGAGCTVDAWETTYLHVLTGEDPVLSWIQGTGLRPVIAALDSARREEFMAQYGALLREAYPREDYGTLLPFRRVFVVAQTSPR